MTTPRKTPYVSMNVTVPARDALQRVALNASAAAGRRISLSNVQLAVVAIAERHADELEAELANLAGKDDR